MTKKSLVLSGNSNQKAVLALEEEGGSLSGRLRLYNFPNEPQGIISLGIYVDGKVTKAGLTRTSSMLYTFKSLTLSMPKDFSCAVINFAGGESEPILYGNSDGVGDQEEVYGAVIEALQGATKMSEVEKTLDENGIEYDDELKEEIDKAIEDEFEKNSCAKCKYREYFFKHNPPQTLSNTRIQEEASPEEKPTFYEEIKGQIDNLFSSSPTEQYLQQLIPNSKWVKVEFDKGGDYYVLGLLYEDDKLKYICYGVPGIFQKTPPKQLSGYPVWFPLDKGNEEGFGYWLTYQDAESGESIKAIVE